MHCSRSRSNNAKYTFHYIFILLSSSFFLVDQHTYMYKRVCCIMWDNERRQNDNTENMLLKFQFPPICERREEREREKRKTSVCHGKRRELREKM